MGSTFCASNLETVNAKTNRLAERGSMSSSWANIVNGPDILIWVDWNGGTGSSTDALSRTSDKVGIAVCSVSLETRISAGISVSIHTISRWSTANWGLVVVAKETRNSSWRKAFSNGRNVQGVAVNVRILVRARASVGTETLSRRRNPGNESEFAVGTNISAVSKSKFAVLRRGSDLLVQVITVSTANFLGIRTMSRHWGNIEEN